MASKGDRGSIGLRIGVKLVGNSTSIVFETEGHLRILVDLDEVAVGITHVATPTENPMQHFSPM